MRRVTRTATAVIVLVVVGLLALGAVPATLESGPGYRLTVDPVEDGPAYQIDDDGLAQRRYEYFFSALDGGGRSAVYYEGPVGIKESFTHSPFDELDTFRTFAPNATADRAVFVSYNRTRYRVALTTVDES